MHLRWPFLGVLAALVLLCGDLSARDSKPAAEETVRSAVTAFLEAVKRHSSEAVMKTVDVPWFHMGEEILKDREQLKKEFDVLFRRRSFSDLRFEILRTAAYEVVRERTSPEERKMLDAVLAPKDYIVLVGVEGPDSKDRKIVLLVRITGAEGKVVGLKE